MMHRQFLFGAQTTTSTLPPVPVPPPFPYAQTVELRSTQTTVYDYYGRVVALSSDGTILVVGSDETSYDSTINGTAGTGRVYVYKLVTGVWGLVATLTASDGVINDCFGESVAVSADGGTIVVGAPNVKIGSNTRQGAVYVFKYNTAAGTWLQSKKIVAADGTPEDAFGYSVSISADGLTIATGAIKDDVLPGYSVGSVYVYNTVAVITVIGSIAGSILTVTSVTSSSGKLSVGTLVTGTGIPADTYITELYSGTTGGIGTYNLSTIVGTLTGITIVGSTNWAQTAKLSASDCKPDDNFGRSISMTTAGDYIAIGSYCSDVDVYANAGAVYLFTKTSSTYTQTTKLTTNVPVTGQGFGFSVSMNSAGTALIVGAPFDGSTVATSNRGCAFIYTRQNTSLSWSQRYQIFATDGVAGDKFGWSVAVSSSEIFFTVGTPGSDVVSGESGAAYIYYNGGTGWVQTAKLSASDAASGDQFGYSVAMTPDALTVAVGAPTNSEATISPTPTNTTRIHGSAYVFTQ
jgi:hypothetical protein